MDAVWVGVVGTAIGGVLGAATTLLAPIVNWNTESKRIALEHGNRKEILEKELAHEMKKMEAEDERRRHEQELEDARLKLDHLRQRVREWREGLERAKVESKEDDKRLDEELKTNHFAQAEFSLAGQSWFETLRPHLQLDQTELSMMQGHFDDSTAESLSDQINRIEREWKLI